MVMAPATFAGAAPRVRQGRVVWDRDAIINAIREWVATYGEPPRAADWNPSCAKWSRQEWRIERYRAGRADGSPWPALNSAKRPFGGSLTEAVRAAGFAPARPGPRRHTDVDLARADRSTVDAEGRALLDAALTQVRAADRRVATLERRLERASAGTRRLRAERDAARRAARAPAKAKVVRERVVDGAAVARARRRADAARAKADEAVREAREQVAGARGDAVEARTAAKRLAARLERCEATIGTLRDERRELKGEVDGLTDRLVAAERLLAAARAEAARAREEAAVAPEVVTVREEAPEAAEVRAARAEAARAGRTAHDAELRAARAERELRETVAAVRGEARRLTPAELADLRADGPSGPAVMAQALKALSAARATANPTRTQAALRRVAQAAVTWQERI
jgi:chromosome segregation ATPase